MTANKPQWAHNTVPPLPSRAAFFSRMACRAFLVQHGVWGDVGGIFIKLFNLQIDGDAYYLEWRLNKRSDWYLMENPIFCTFSQQKIPDLGWKPAPKTLAASCGTATASVWRPPPVSGLHCLDEKKMGYFLWFDATLLLVDVVYCFRYVCCCHFVGLCWLSCCLIPGHVRTCKNNPWVIFVDWVPMEFFYDLVLNWRNGRSWSWSICRRSSM